LDKEILLRICDPYAKFNSIELAQAFQTYAPDPNF
jgi:hypothetical protein